MDEVTRLVEMLVVDDSLMAYEAIVGIDVLSKGKMIIEGCCCSVMTIAKNALHIGGELQAGMEDNLVDLVNAYSDCFGEKLPELGKSKCSKMEIKATSPKPNYE